MLKLEFHCESQDEARMYLNAQAYLNLIDDFYVSVRASQKHGTDADVLAKVNAFMPEFARAVEHNKGAY